MHIGSRVPGHVAQPRQAAPNATGPQTANTGATGLSATNSSEPKPASNQAAFSFEGLLASGTVASVIKTQDDGELRFVDPKRNLTSQEWLARTWLESQAIEASGEIPENSPARFVTQTDKNLFRELTGYNYVTLHNGTTIVDDAGNEIPPSPKVDAARALVEQAAHERQVGLFSGEITADFAEKMFVRYAEAEQRFDSGGVMEILAHLRAREAA